MFNLNDFLTQAANNDFQRSNMFSIVFATTPSSKTRGLFDDLGGAIYDGLGGTTDIIGLRPADISDLLETGTRSVARGIFGNSGESFLFGAMTNRVVQSLLGEFDVGTFVLDFFNMANPYVGIMARAVRLPENRISYEMDRTHNAPSIKLLDREYDPLIVTFRMDSKGANYRAFNDWVNAVKDPVTGLVSLPVDVECDIQVNLHGRDGVPHTVAMYNGAIPVAVSAPTLDYEEENIISVFDVTFAYSLASVGAVGREAAIEWLEDAAINAISGISDQNNLSASASELAKLNGATTSSRLLR